MAISDVDFKVLWGRAAGFCSNPDCCEDLTVVIKNENYNIGEMAHIIAKSENGPRGIKDCVDNSYNNLILLCPNCHKHIDKGPKSAYPKAVILEWKEKAENRRSSIVTRKHSFVLEDIFTLGYNAFNLQNNLKCLKDNRHILDKNWYMFLFQCLNRIKFHLKSIHRFDEFADEIENAYKHLRAYGTSSENSYNELWYATVDLCGCIKRKFTENKEKKVIYLSETLANFFYYELLKKDALERDITKRHSRNENTFGEYEEYKNVLLDTVISLSNEASDVDKFKQRIEKHTGDDRHDVLYQATTHIINKNNGACS